MRATLDIHPEYGLICSSPYNKTSDDPGENDENEKITADTNALMDQIEKDGVVMNKAFEEPDNLYEPNYDDYNCEDSSDDNTDIEKSINDGESGDDFEFD